MFLRNWLFLLLSFLLFAWTGICAAQDTNFSSGPQYLVTTESTMFLHPISTPKLSLDEPIAPVLSLPEIGPPVANQPYVANPSLQNQANLFPIYYGYPMIIDVELTSEEPRELPASISGVGFVEIADAQSLRQLGYGVTVGEAASFWKAHRPHASRVFTNADIARLHGG